MTMQSGQGHCAGSSQSRKSEKVAKRWVKEVVSEPEFKSDFSLDFSGYTINDVYGTSLCVQPKKRKPSDCDPDFGILRFRDKVVGLGDNKYQKGSENAVERVNLYSMDALVQGILPNRVFVHYEGAGYTDPLNENKLVGNTGKQVLRSMHWNVEVTNADKETFKDKYREYLRRIKREETDTEFVSRRDALLKELNILQNWKKSS